jgi:hypothetical protein
MHVEIPDGLQNLHFDTLTLSLTRVNWVEWWSNAQIISLIDLVLRISSIRDGEMQLGARMMVSSRIQCWAKVYKKPPKGSPRLMFENDSIMVIPSACHPC